MLNDHLQRFYLLLALGSATVLLGLLNLALSRFCLRSRLVLGLGVYSSVLVGVGTFAGDRFALTGATVLGSLAVFLCIYDRFRFVTQAFNSPKRVSVTLSIVGSLAIGGSLYLYACEEEAYFSQLDDDFVGMVETAALAPVPEVPATTDRGRVLVMKTTIDKRTPERLDQLNDRALQEQRLVNRVIMHEPADELSNCHGWVFTGGRYWVSGADVDSILSDNGYHTVEKPRPGDLVVYRRQGQVAHTAVVRYVTEGRPVLVEGKWGAFGVFLHEVDRSCYPFGFTYYTTNRLTHLLREFASPSDLPTVMEGSLTTDDEEWED